MMKQVAIRLVVSLLTFAIGLVSAALLHPTRSHAVSNSQDEQAILRVERQYIQANLDGDTATLDEILADDFTLTFAGGHYRRVESKARRLARLETLDLDFESIATDNVKVEVNGDRALLTGEAYTESRDTDMELHSQSYNFFRIYEKRQGRWQIVSVRTSW
ncbi:MAG TPA: nuclear transport factor 2 family protein [Pyrinomonadaceae bacterium]